MLRRTPLRRYKGLSAKAIIHQRRPLRWSPNRVPQKVRRAVLERAGGRCEVCGRADEPLQMHHRLPRSRGGRHLAEVLLAVCARCHRRIHLHPRWAYEHGYLLRGYGVMAQ